MLRQDPPDLCTTAARAAILGLSTSIHTAKPWVTKDCGPTKENLKPCGTRIPVPNTIDQAGDYTSLYVRRLEYSNIHGLCPRRYRNLAPRNVNQTERIDANENAGA